MLALLRAPQAISPFLLHDIHPWSLTEMPPIGGHDVGVQTRFGKYLRWLAGSTSNSLARGDGVATALVRLALHHQLKGGPTSNAVLRLVGRLTSQKGRTRTQGTRPYQSASARDLPSMRKRNRDGSPTDTFYSQARQTNQQRT
jgi:hypothetical protein